MQYLNLNMVKGDTLCFGAKVKGVEMLNNVWFSCKKSINDENYVFQKSLNGGIDLIEDTTYRIRVAPEDTREVETGTYYYDLQISRYEDIYTILQGTLTINQEITKEW